MKYKNSFTLFLLLCFLACDTSNETQSEIPFDKTKWSTKEGLDYPYRNQMLNDVVYNDTIRTLDEAKILDFLGQPDYKRKEYLYYRITEKRLGTWILHTKTMVIKLSEADSIDWIKIHE